MLEFNVHQWVGNLPIPRQLAAVYTIANLVKSAKLSPLDLCRQHLTRRIHSLPGITTHYDMSTSK